ncbi:MAG: protein kinase [Endozoicomonadaceae bacterium]|nr:protein kinase [Endozoicomonadaceae bacterium]
MKKVGYSAPTHSKGKLRNQNEGKGFFYKIVMKMKYKFQQLNLNPWKKMARKYPAGNNQQERAKKLLRSQQLFDFSSKSSDKDDKVEQTQSNEAQKLFKEASHMDKEHMTRGKGLATGSFGSISEAFSGKGSAMLITKEQDYSDTAQQEIEIMKQILPHGNVARYVSENPNEPGTINKMGTTIITYSPYGGVALKRLVHVPGQPPLPGKLIKGFLQQALKGLNHLHQHNILHRDIKPDNLVTKPDGRLTVIDLGSAINMNETNPVFSGTLAFIAPEVLSKYINDSDHKPTEKSDIYSLGMTFTMLLTGLTESDDMCTTDDFLTAQLDNQYQHISDPKNQAAFIEKRAKALQENLKGSLNEHEIKQLTNLLEQMCDHNPEKRPTAEEALRDPFIANFVPDFLKGAPNTRT